MSLLTILIILLVCALVWGGFGYGRVAPGAPWVGGWSPLGVLLLILLVLLLTGNLGAIRLR